MDRGLEWLVCFICIFLSVSSTFIAQSISHVLMIQMWRFNEFGGPLHQRPVQDLAFAVARFIQKGGSFVNYYMVGLFFNFLIIILLLLFLLNSVVRLLKIYCVKPLLLKLISCVCNVKQYHGGTNFGRTAGGPFITTSYDYDAPIDEYGENRNPICPFPKSYWSWAAHFYD